MSINRNMSIIIDNVYYLVHNKAYYVHVVSLNEKEIIQLKTNRKKKNNNEKPKSKTHFFLIEQNNYLRC